MSDEQRRRNNNNRHRGSKFEKTVADQLGFEVVPYSGSNARFGYGDIKHPTWLGECKNITLRARDRGKTIRIDNEWITDIVARAMGVGKRPMLAFMASGSSIKFVIIPSVHVDEYSDFFPCHIHAVHRAQTANGIHWNFKFDGLISLVKIGSYVIVDKADMKGNTLGEHERIALVRLETFKDVIMPYVANNDRSQQHGVHDQDPSDD